MLPEHQRRSLFCLGLKNENGKSREGQPTRCLMLIYKSRHTQRGQDPYTERVRTGGFV